MAHSVHTARWISQIADLGWEIHLFPSLDDGVVNPALKNITVHHSVFGWQWDKKASTCVRRPSLFLRATVFLRRKLLELIISNDRAAQLANLIQRIKPDIIHSMETQAAGYLTLEAERRCKHEFPQWIHTVWGSDIFLFGRLTEHRGKIREVLSNCDYFTAEGDRDIKLARKFGFAGKVLLVAPATGGFDISACAPLRKEIANRRIIMLKGYQHFAGRALVGLRALERCSELLKEYTVVVFSGNKNIEIAAELFTDSTQIPTKVLPEVSHQEILKLQGEARISISLSISDGVPNSMLESIVMGSFPIQSWTACYEEWIEDGINGILVPPEDPDVVEQAIRQALSDDDLVNRAAKINYRLAAEKLDYSLLKSKTIELYTSVAKDEWYWGEINRLTLNHCNSTKPEKTPKRLPDENICSVVNPNR